MNYMDAYYPESRFGGFSDIDGTIIFYGRVNALLTPSSIVLDVGCGRGACIEDPVPYRRNLCMLKGKAAKVIGIDVDPDARNNPCLDEFHLLKDVRWPLADNSVDLVVCDNVLEHIADVGLFFAEMKRVLRDGGFICLRTPNRWGYVALAARLIPNRYHKKALSIIQSERQETDVFPTLYRCNTVGKLRATLRGQGFDCAVYGYEAEPSYLGFSRLTYGLGVLHQRIACRALKPALFAFGQIRKP